MKEIPYRVVRAAHQNNLALRTICGIVAIGVNALNLRHFHVGFMLREFHRRRIISPRCARAELRLC